MKKSNLEEKLKLFLDGKIKVTDLEGEYVDQKDYKGEIITRTVILKFSVKKFSGIFGAEDRLVNWLDIRIKRNNVDVVVDNIQPNLNKDLTFAGEDEFKTNKGNLERHKLINSNGVLFKSIQEEEEYFLW